MASRHAQHHDFDDGRHSQTYTLTVHQESRTQRFDGTEQYNQEGGNQEEGNRPAGLPHTRYLRGLYRRILYRTFLQPALVFRVVHQFFSHFQRAEGPYQYARQRSRYRNLQDIEQGEMRARQQPQQRHGSSRDGTGRNGLLRSDDSDTQRAFGTDTGFTRHFGNDRQYRISDMPRTGYKRKQVGHERAQDSHPRRILPQNPFCQLHHILQSAGCLHTRCRRYHRRNHQHDVHRRSRRLKTKYKCQDEQTYTSHHTQADAPQTGTDNDSR